MSKQAITSYYKNIDRYKRYGGTHNESSIRRAFANLLEEYCLTKNLILVDELHLKNSAKRPDGTIRDALQQDWGHWESKDEKDDLDKEIDKKFEIGYPKFNILFENSIEIVLIQKGEEVLRGEMIDADFLHRVLSEFTRYELQEIVDFRKAIEKFKEDVPDILKVLRKMIKIQSETNQKFISARAKFWEMCKESINPDISSFDIREMLIQHILTHEIFATVFDDAEFHRENNIAKELQSVVDTFFTKATRKNTLIQIDSYYKTIKREAANINNHHEKQNFLKVLYENFYKAYNPKGADKLGIVYTPNEIVKFMIESTDYLLDKHFGKTLADKNVEILDPATGTGTFITDIIEHIPPQYLKYKYLNEIHCNELAILPYYIANLNIEFTYQQKMNEYEPFENIVFVDTLENLGFLYPGKQHDIFAMTTENVKRIKKQNYKNISVIIGNPPYNANQQNENDNNKNREYPEIDKRIKDTYVKYSTAQKTKVYDMYARFYRWAMDRLNENGIIAFITNRSFINSKTFDGFRKVVSKEFDYLYIIDLKGDIRSKTDKKLPTGNVFSIMTGVAIGFFIKQKENYNLNCKIKYSFVSDKLNKKQKLEFLQDNNLKNIAFETITPDKNNNWINLTDNDFDTFLPITNKETKLSKNKNDEKAVFKLFASSIKTNRDEWVYDFDENNLKKKIRYFIKVYNSEVKNFKRSKTLKEINDYLDYSIKWSRDLKNKLLRKRKAIYRLHNIVKSNWRPFISKFFYAEKLLNDVLTNNHYKIFGEQFEKNNNVIYFSDTNSNKTFHLLAQNSLSDYHFVADTQSLPFYSYNKSGVRIENITDWGLEQFTEHYKNEEIIKLDIFHYTYGVLHNPAYRKKYELNLKREFPRLPFYKDFWKWTNWGKKLMDLHINYESLKPYKLQITEADKIKEVPKVKLRRNKNTNEILLDENTSILNIPDIAFEYKFGNRSAIDWILDQYKEKKPRDKTIREKFNTYRFADYKKQVIDLISCLTTVSIKTMEIVNQMETEESHIDK